MSKNSMSVKRIKHPMVKGYLQKNFPGMVIYINHKNRFEALRNGRKRAVKILSKAGYSEKEICKTLKIFPCQLKTIARKRKYTRKSVREEV